MTNMNRTQGATLPIESAASDPIDALIPPPLPRWARLIAAVALIGSVATVSFLWGFGYIYPQPDCCGSGSGSRSMSLSKDGKAVIVAADLMNSSGRRLQIVSATADLPGATVLGVELFDEAYSTFVQTRPLPGSIAGHDHGQLAITFTPDRCTDEGHPWGIVTTRLEVINGWLPGIGRTFTLPDQGWMTPLATACKLLGRG